jgi:hypothetical protein
MHNYPRLVGIPTYFESKIRLRNPDAAALPPPAEGGLFLFKKNGRGGGPLPLEERSSDSLDLPPEAG